MDGRLLYKHSSQSENQKCKKCKCMYVMNHGEYAYCPY